MQVYIEYVIIDNFVMDYLILKSSLMLTKNVVSVKRLLISSGVGTIFATIMPILKISVFWSFILKLLISMLMCFIVISELKIFEYIKLYNVFLLLTFLLGGGVIATFSVMGIEYNFNGYSAEGILPVGVNLLIGYISAIIIKKIVTRLFFGISDKKFEYTCLVILGGKSFKLTGYLDSGNKLFDKNTGLPIAICDNFLIKKISILGGLLYEQGKMKYTTVGGYGEMTLYHIDCIYLYNGNKVKKIRAILGAVKEKNFTEDLLLSVYFA